MRQNLCRHGSRGHQGRAAARVLQSDHSAVPGGSCRSGSQLVRDGVPRGKEIGLGYEQLSRRTPRLIYTSITPFGDRGPGRDYQWADIITWAAGGMMYMMGEEGKPPVQMSLPQAGLHAGGEAAVASMIAHYPRQVDGFGQKIVVNMQACIVWTLMNEQAMPIQHGDHN